MTTSLVEGTTSDHLILDRLGFATPFQTWSLKSQITFSAMLHQVHCRLFLSTYISISSRNTKPNVVSRLVCHAVKWLATELISLLFATNFLFFLFFNHFLSDEVRQKHPRGGITTQHQQPHIISQELLFKRFHLSQLLDILIVRVVSDSRRWTSSFSKIIMFNHAIGDLPEYQDRTSFGFT